MAVLMCLALGVLAYYSFSGFRLLRVLLVLLGVPVMAIWWGRYSPLREMIDAFDETGNRTCPRCGYDLRSLPGSGACPECGEPFSPELLAGARERLDRYYERCNPKSR